MKINLTMIVRSLAAVVGLVLIAGCGNSNEAGVSGTVTLDGKPLPFGTITFYPAQSGPIAYATIQMNGAYEIRTGTNCGLAVGEYRVAIIAMEPSKMDFNNSMPPAPDEMLTPARYGDPKTSDLKATVAAGSNRFDFALKP